MKLLMYLKAKRKRLDFLNRKKRHHLRHFRTTINYQKPKKERLERHYKKKLEAIRLANNYYRFRQRLVEFTIEALHKRNVYMSKHTQNTSF